MYIVLVSFDHANSFITSRYFFEDSYACNHVFCEESFTSSFTISMPLISLSCLIALARTACKMSNENGNDGHLCFVLYLKGKAFSFPSLNMTLAIGFHIRTLLDLGRSFLFLFC